MPMSTNAPSSALERPIARSSGQAQRDGEDGVPSGVSLVLFAARVA